VDKSLIRRVDERYSMLETIREYALERLGESGEEDEVRQRHADLVVARAEAEEGELTFMATSAAAVARLDADLENVRSALGWACASGEPEHALRTASALRRYWQLRGLVSEGRHWLGRALAAAEEVPPAVRAKALAMAALLAQRQGDHAEARELGERSLALFRELGDVEWTARALGELGRLAIGEGDFERATVLFEESLAAARDAGDEHEVAKAVGDLADAALARGERERAEQLLEEALALQLELGALGSAAISYHNLGRVAIDLGDYDRAAELLARSAGLGRELGFKEVLAHALEGLVELAHLRGDTTRAARLAGAVEALLEELDVLLHVKERASFEQTLRALRERLGDNGLDAARQRGRELTLDQAIAEAVEDETPERVG
jgi:tetratricopeptide (TPR) repeat protein